MAALVHPKRNSLSTSARVQPHPRGQYSSMEPLAERSLLGSPGAPSSMDDDESVLMRPSQQPFLRTIKEHKPVRVVAPKRHLLETKQHHLGDGPANCEDDLPRLEYERSAIIGSRSCGVGHALAAPEEDGARLRAVAQPVGLSSRLRAGPLGHVPPRVALGAGPVALDVGD